MCKTVIIGEAMVMACVPQLETTASVTRSVKCWPATPRQGFATLELWRAKIRRNECEELTALCSSAAQKRPFSFSATVLSSHLTECFPFPPQNV